MAIYNEEQTEGSTRRHDRSASELHHKSGDFDLYSHHRSQSSPRVYERLNSVEPDFLRRRNAEAKTVFAETMDEKLSNQEWFLEYRIEIGHLLMLIRHFLDTYKVVFSKVLLDADGSPLMKGDSMFMRKLPDLPRAKPGESPILDPILEEWIDKWSRFFVNDKNWRDVYSNELKQKARRASNDAEGAVEKKSNRFQTHWIKLSENILEYSKVSGKKHEKRVVKIKESKTNYRTNEAERFRNVSQRNIKLEKVCARTWSLISRSLANERGPWHVSQDRRIYWKLDKTENSLRMRKRLKINYEGTDHRDASDAAKQSYTNKGQATNEEETEATTTAEGEIELEGILAGIKLARAETIEMSTDPMMVDDPYDDSDTEIPSDFHEEKQKAKTPRARRPKRLNFSQNNAEEKPVHVAKCELTSPGRSQAGTFEITTTHVYFYAEEGGLNKKDRYKEDYRNGEYRPSVENKGKEKEEKSDKLAGHPIGSLLGVNDRKWSLSDIVDIHFRRYQLRHCAMEIFFCDQSNNFVNFFNESERNRAYQILANQPIINLQQSLSWQKLKNPMKVIERSGLTVEWQRRKISNFEYLMALNTIAGRSFNDLTQYPVFPWILSDYDSEEIDLKDDSVYRDLSKPVGALNADRLQMFVDRYNHFEHEEIPKFHYGSHYSTLGTVLFFLTRLEPFTTLALQLQDGKFDHADRLFDSISGAFHGCLHNAADVKELIPEFFFLPDFLRNLNRYDLGCKQTGRPIDNVLLPKWAKTPEEFIRINREALESEHVSNNLHHWIDLIFGYKQRGEEAVKANNVFFHLTYEGAVDIDKIKDPMLRDATIAQIDSFGQTPSLIFEHPHPKRFGPDDVVPPLFKRLGDLVCYKHVQVTSQQTVQASGKSQSTPVASDISNPLLYLHHTPERVLSIGLDRILGIHKWKQSTPEYVPPFLFEVERQQKSGKSSSRRGGNSNRRIGVHFAAGVTVQPFFFAVSLDFKVLFSCGHWDNSFKCSNIETGKVIQSIQQHKDVVTCLAVDGAPDRGSVLVTGSKDTTIIVWDIDGELGNNGQYVNVKPRHILAGHDDEVTCIALNTDLDTVISGSKDGTMIVHSILSGEYIRTIHPSRGESISLCAISSEGDLACYSLSDLQLSIYSINGVLKQSDSTNERVYTLLFSADGEYIVTGGQRKTVVMRYAHNLQVAYRFEDPRAIIRCLATTPGEQHLLVGLANGKIVIYALDAAYLRERTLAKLTNLGF